MESSVKAFPLGRSEGLRHFWFICLFASIHLIFGLNRNMETNDEIGINLEVSEDNDRTKPQSEDNDLNERFVLKYGRIR